MKISKTSWIIITVLLLTISGVLLGNQFNQQNEQKMTLESQLNLAKKKLASLDNDQLIAQKNALTTSIQSYTSQISLDKNILSSSLDNIDITNLLLADAEKCGVDILEISSAGSSEEVLSGTLCKIQAINIRTLGIMDNSSKFIYSLKDVFPTSCVKSVDLSVAEPPLTPAAQPTVTPTEPPDPSVTSTPTPSRAPFKDTTATINLVIYSYKGN